MPTYISLVSWTDQGIRNVKEVHQRIDAFKKRSRLCCGKVNGFYFTMGKYDGVVIVECPSDEAVAAIVLRGESGGNVRTETMKAFTEDQFRNIITTVQ